MPIVSRSQAMSGVDSRTIACSSGHATIQRIMRYAHLSPDHNQAGVDRPDGFEESRNMKADISEMAFQGSAVTERKWRNWQTHQT
jgi:hypothetical protein